MISHHIMYDITCTVFMKSLPLYQLNQTHSPYDITHSMYDITFSMRDITWILYDVTPIYVRYHLQYFYDVISNIYMISPVLLSWKHKEYTWHLTHHIWHHSHCICVVTPALSMPSQQLRKSSHFAHVWHHTQTTSHHIHTLWHQWSCFMKSQTLHSWHQISCLWHHIHFFGHHTTLCMTSGPLCLTSLPLYLCHHIHPFNDITAPICMTSHPVYLSHHIHYIYDIISTKYDITTLCVDDNTRHMYDIFCTADDNVHTLSPQATIFMMSCPLQAWHRTHCITHCTHCIFVITSSPLISHPLLNGITPTFCVTSYALYITSHPILMSSHYCTYDITASIYETTSSM